MKVFRTITCLAMMTVGSGAAHAQSVPQTIDFEAILTSCSADSDGCVARLQAALTQINALKATTSTAVIDNLLGSLATVAASAAQQSPSISRDLGGVVNSIAESSSAERQESLREVAGNISSGRSGEIDLSAIAGSPA